MSRNAINHLRDSDDSKISNPVQIKSMIEKFYFNLLGCANNEVVPYSVDHLRSIHPLRCSETLPRQLVSLPTAEEIKNTLFAMPKNKAPGPDEFTMEFFSNSWDLVGGDLVAAISEFFSSGGMLRQVNTTAISSIPKDTGAERLNEFRPISCCNTVYKVISRILSSQLRLFLDKAVQGNQVGFVSGRLLCENVLLASELVADF